MYTPKALTATGSEKIVPSMYSAMHKKRYKSKFIFKGPKINFLKFFLRGIERALRYGDNATKPKEFDQSV